MPVQNSIILKRMHVEVVQCTPHVSAYCIIALQKTLQIFCMRLRTDSAELRQSCCCGHMATAVPNVSTTGATEVSHSHVGRAHSEPGGVSRHHWHHDTAMCKYSILTATS